MCSVGAMLTNKLSLQELNQLIGIKLLISGFPEILAIKSRCAGGRKPVLP